MSKNPDRVGISFLVILVAGIVFFSSRIIFLGISSRSQVAQVAGGLQFSVNSSGIQSLSYNGYNFISQAYYNDKFNTAVFQTPGGSQVTYTDRTDAATSTANVSSLCPANDQCFEHTYRSGGADSYTVKMVLSSTDSRTAKLDVYVTNNDPTDTLEKVTMEYFLGSNFTTPDLAGGNSLWFKVGSDDGNAAPVAFIRGNSWGSIAMFTDNYNDPSIFYDEESNNSQSAGSNGQPQNYIFVLQNYSTPGGAPGNATQDAIPPGQTWHYPLYIRFGSSNDTAQTLAPEAFTSFAAAFPNLVNWPSRAPIARIYLASGNDDSAENPRGYFSDPTFNVSNQTAFSARMLAYATSSIAIMNAMNPRPQGILVWDLEGEEFNQDFTYVGNPNQLPNLSPEMDAVADQFFSLFKNAGYRIGMTLRPSNFQTGTTLPATCNSNPDAYLQDVFIKTNAPYPYQGYACTAPNTWTQPGANNPYYQTCSWDDDTILNNLESKVRYAENRWGATLFYIDSTVYCTQDGGGGAISDQIIRQLQTDFPTALFFPEGQTAYDFGASAPYNQVNLGTYDVPATTRYIYPGAFTLLADYDGVNFQDPTTFQKLVTSVKDGNILTVDGWWNNPENAEVDSVYQAAGLGGPAPINPPPPSTPIPITPISIPINPTLPITPPSSPNPPTEQPITPNTPAPTPPTSAPAETTPEPAPGPSCSTYQTTTVPPLTSQERNLKYGSQGTAVNDLQQYLAVEGFLSEQSVTGYYGNLTRAAVVKYEADSVSKTITTCSGGSEAPGTSRLPASFSFTSSLGLGSSGQEVKDLQIFLNDQDFLISHSGNGSYAQETTYFGYGTQAALERFQRYYATNILASSGLSNPTGYFGPATMKEANEILSY